MKMTKRILSLVLCFVMLVGLMPNLAFLAKAEETTATVLDAAVIFSDLHTSKSDYKESTLKGIMTAVKNTGLPVSSVTSAGDAFSVNNDSGKYTGRTSTITGYIQDVLGEIPVNYVWSDHDRYAMQEDDKTLLSNDSGLVYGAGVDGQYGTEDDANYYIFSLSMADLSTNNRYNADFHTDAEVTEAIADFTSAVAGLKKDRPLFIASHQPLFDRRNDNGHAYEWATAINAAAETMDIAFFFGHNHNYDVAGDYYYAKGSTMSVCSDSSGNAKNVVLNFTHMCAGYMAPSSTGSTSSTTRQGVAVVITIYADSINYTTYGSGGVYSGNYALNETVKREFAKTEPEVPETSEPEVTEPEVTEPSVPETTVPSEPEIVEKTHEATGVTVAAPGITGLAVSVIENPTYDTKAYGAYASFDITVEGHVDGVEATVTLPAPAGFDAEKPVLILYAGEVIATTSIVEGKISFTTDHFSVYDAAQTAEGDLEWIHISTSTGETYYELAKSLESGATYLIASGASNSVRLLSKTGSRSSSVSVSNSRITSGGEDYEWLFTASGNGYTIQDADKQYLYPNASRSYSSWNYSLVHNGSTATPVTVSMNRSSGATTLSRSVTSSNRSTTAYLRYSSNAFGASGSSGNLYLFKKVTQPGGSVYAAMDGQSSFTFNVGEYDADAIRNAISVYTATDANGTGKAPTTDYQLVGTVNGGVAGTYELSVQYGGKELGKITVVMSSDPYLKITENGEETELIFKKNVLVNDTVQLGVKAFNGTDLEGNPDVIWEIPEEYAGMATVDGTGKVTFLVDRANFLVKASWTVGGKELTDTIQIIITPDNYLTPGTSTNDFPEYPNQGAIRYGKTAEAVGNFSETGVTQLELSMTGIPFSAPKTLDVVLMLDHSNSMTEDRMAATRAAVEVFVNNIVKNADGSFNGNRIYIASFAGGNPDYAGQSRHEFRIYQMTAKEDDGFQIVNDQDELDALIAEINSTYVKFSSSTAPYGTEYDQSLEDCYNVLNAVKADGNQQFCVFMSDGIPNVYRYGAGANDQTTSSSAMANLFASSGNTKYATRGTNYKYEYWSSLMKQNGVTVFSVGLGLNGTNSSLSDATAAECERVSNMLLNDISGPAGETAADRDTGNAITKKDKYFFSVADENAAEDMENVFTNIASQIMMAATDIVVTDKISNEYTMIFGVPQSASDDEKAAERNAAVAEALAGQDLYIEVVNYTLDAQHERTSTVDTLTRIYLKDSNGTAAGGTYSAATDEAGTAAPALTFTAKAEGKRGYWSQFTGTAGADDIVINVNGTNWKFMEQGDGTHNVTSGAYAFGNIDEQTNMSEDLVIVTPYFAYSANTRMLAWTADKVEEFKELALRYFLYLDDSSTEIGTSNETDSGTYETNEWAYITYTNHLGNDCRREFPVPQMTWNGAQVSYVFYLVNENGEPINKAGETVDFANATFITDIFTEFVVWNDTDTPTQEGHAYLEAEWMAQDKLPTGYTLYDTEAYYELKVYEDHEGNVLDNYFKIDGSEVNGANESTTKVYNTKAGEKHSAYGTYTAKESTNFDDEIILENFDFANTTVAFAVVWKLQLNPDTVVVDYGLDVLINVVENDLIANTLTGISKTERGNLAVNTGIAGNSAFTSQTLDFDNFVFSVEGENQIRFHQKNMQFKEPIKIYYETKSTDYINGTARTGYMYSSLTVIPATTIYYEDTFVTLSSYTEQEDGSYKKDDTTAWAVEGTNISSVQQQDRPGASQISAALDADNNYGYDAAYKNMSTYSMGASRKIHLTPGHDGQADFDFYGTGFDVISLTSNKTGTIVVEVYNYAENTDYKDAVPVKSFVVDTYYGYAYGPFMQTFTYTDGEWVMTEKRVDALGESEDVPADPKEGTTYVVYENKWYTVDSNDPAALYQVPVMKISGLTYGRYHAKIVAFYDEFFDNTGDNSYDFYLDAIRIYDPTGNQNKEANDAYIEDGEGWPTYEEVRNYVIDANTFNSLGDDEEISGIVFIDSSTSGHPVPAIADYTSFGPNNELYLAPGQAIAFVLTPGANVAEVQMALKTVGMAGKVEIVSIVNGTEETILSSSISTATDMYYTIWESETTKDQEGNEQQTQAPASMTMVIRNTGDEDAAIISITNVKITHTSAPVARMMMFAVRRPAIEEALETMTEETKPETEPTEPEITEPSEPETEATEPETEVTEPETEPTEPETEATEPETEPTEPETEPETEPSKPSPEEQVEEVIRVVKKIIKGFLGWLFG